MSIIDAGHFDAQTAYAAINTLRLDDLRPHIYRTHDGGKTWTEITNGIPDGAPVNAVREDPKRKGLLFAGTEREVYVSFDDGDHWQSLRLNMPATSIRDLIVNDDDLVAGTHGRGFWILDDITPLRQLGATSQALECSTLTLFKPQIAYRVRQNTNTDTPMPPDEAAGTNPPDGAIINYTLASAASGPVTLEILDAAGKSCAATRAPIAARTRTPPPRRCRSTGIARRRRCRRSAGMHRFLWDMHYQPIPGGGGGRGGLPIAAVPHDTVPAPSGPWARARPVHREADRRRQELHAAADAEDGSARHDAGARPRAAVHAVEAVVRRDHRRAEDAGGDSRAGGRALSGEPSALG